MSRDKMIKTIAEIDGKDVYQVQQQLQHVDTVRISKLYDKMLSEAVNKQLDDYLAS